MSTKRRQLTAYLNDEEFVMADELAKSGHTTMSKLVIRLIRDESKRFRASKKKASVDGTV